TYTKELRHHTIGDNFLTHQKSVSLGYETQTDPLNRIKRINNTLYFADNASLLYEDNNKEFVALEPGIDSPQYFFGEYPDPEVESIEKSFLFSKSNTSNPSGTRFVAFYTKFNRFKIYNTDGNIIKDTFIEDENLTSEDINKDGFLYRSAIWASNEYIYTIGYNGTNKQIFEDFDETFRTFVEVWDWNGNLLNSMKFDRLIHNYTVSEKHNKIYAYSYLHEDKIFEYNLDDLF
ncbi:MAG: hypothetical protein WD512_16920, partial [Candidatus Paceibacterota bacterium]